MQQPPETERKSQFAKRLGLTPGRISQMIAAGMPVEPDGKLNIAACLQWIEAHLDPSRSIGARAAKNGHAEPEAEGIGSLYDAKLAHLRIQVDRARLSLERERGQLIDRDRAIDLVFRLAREERDAWVNWPARVAALLAIEIGADPGTVQTALERHVRQHLEELAEVRFAP